MTHEEAIKSLVVLRSTMKHCYDFEADIRDCIEDDPIALINKAIEAMEKQIPKKKHKYSGFRCVCGELVAKNQDYCEYCGQRL